jgi:DNA ligase (NAD+)
LKNYGIQICRKYQSNATDKLVGKIFVVSGVLNSFPDELKKVIEDNGGKIGSSISAKYKWLETI